MAVNFLDNIDLNGNQLLNARLEVLASDPGSANSGDIIYNSTSNVFKYYNGSAWVDPSTGTYTAWEMIGDSGTGQSITDGTTVDWAGGTGITTATTSNTLTITNSKPFDSLTLASTTGSNSTISNSGTITIAAGTGITTTNNGSGQVTIAATGSGSMSSFTLAGDTGSNQTISDGDTVTVKGGTNISTVGSATDIVSINLDDSITLAGTLTVSGTGQSSFAGQVTVPATPSASTDAASKGYVDASVVGNLVFQGGYNAATNTPDLDSSPSGSIKKGWSYVVTAAGSFFTETVEVGDFLIAQQDAPTTLANWVTVQNNVGLATISTVGIGNTNVTASGNAGSGLTLSYSSGTATLGVDIKNQDALSAIAEMLFLVHDEGDTGTNGKVTIDSMATYFAANTGKQFVGTSSSATTHTFNHNLNSFQVQVQLYDTSSKETVYASVDRTSVNQVVVTTAAAASLTCLIDKIS